MCSHSPWAPVEGGQSGLELCEENPGLGSLGLELGRQPTWFPRMSHSLLLQRTSFLGKHLPSRQLLPEGREQLPHPGGKPLVPPYGLRKFNTEIKNHSTGRGGSLGALSICLLSF